jgi:TPR repeat protein
MPSTRTKRARGEGEEEAGDDRRKKVIKQLVEEWTCPITYALLVDPVVAEDGRLYERAAIEEYMERKAGQLVVKSPVTNEDMGKRLIPAPYVRTAIASLVEGGLVDAESAGTWRQERVNLAQVTALRAKAEAGDSHAMGRLGFSYRDGTRGLRKDPVEAFKWFKKASDRGDPPAATSCGVAYINGSGVERNHVRGMIMITRAATLGSEHACAVLGWANECGHHGLDQDSGDATEWYKKMQAASCKDSVDPYRERARDWLRDHP